MDTHEELVPESTSHDGRPTNKDHNEPAEDEEAGEQHPNAHNTSAQQQMVLVEKDSRRLQTHLTGPRLLRQLRASYSAPHKFPRTSPLLGSNVGCHGTFYRSEVG